MKLKSSFVKPSEMLLFAITLLFFGLCNGIILQCDYSSTGEWYATGKLYWCDAKVIQHGNKRAVTFVSGTHASGKTNDQVLGMWIRDQSVDFIPRDITKHFKNIHSIAIGRTKLKSITKEDLRQFPSLRLLHLESNPIEVLDGDLLTFIPKVERVNIFHSKITYVGSDLFSNSKSLNYVSLAGNTCINEDATTPSAIEDLKRKLVCVCPDIKC
jgi:hypothetical protein